MAAGGSYKDVSVTAADFASTGSDDFYGEALEALKDKAEGIITFFLGKTVSQSKGERTKLVFPPRA